MTQKKLYIIAICFILSVHAFAGRTTFKEQSDNWLKQTEGNANGRPGIGGNTPEPTPPIAPQATPIGDTGWILLSGALAYGIYVFGKKQKDEKYKNKINKACSRLTD
jgi:hypothetical protein